MIHTLTARRLIQLSLAATTLLALGGGVELWTGARHHTGMAPAAALTVIAIVCVGLLRAAALRLPREAAPPTLPAPAQDIQERARQPESEEIESRVQRRTAELSSLTNHLQHMSENEKASLARMLHDELGGLLIAVKMDASWLYKRWPNPTPEIQARWARVLKVLDDSVDFKRRVMENLRPTLLDNIGLLPAVRWIVEETCGAAGLQYTEIYPEQEPALSEEASIMMFRLVQESLVNVVKHAHATHVRVQIELDSSQMSLLIEDNGSGIEPERGDAISAHGLAIMRHRVRNSGGTLQLETAAHGGTRVYARFPLERIVRAQVSQGESVQASAAVRVTPARAL
jgi:signal transduction histidine kinase